MPYDVLRNAALLAGGLLCAALFALFWRREPRRVSCGVLLMLALYLTTRGALKLFFPDRISPSGDLMLGDGEETLFLLQLLFFLVSFFGGIALCVNGAGLVRREGASLAHALPILFGVGGIVYPFLLVLPFLVPPDTLLWSVATELWSMLWMALLYVPGMLGAMLLQSLAYALYPKRRDVDYIVVLGAGVRADGTVTPIQARRLDRALRLYRAGGEKATFVVSGGQGTDERVSEACAMRRYLLQKGVPEAQILPEDRSRSTDENIRFSKALIEARVGGEYSCMVATSNYHVLRAVFLARQHSLPAHGVGGFTPLYFLPAGFIREYIAIIFRYKRLLGGYMLLVLLLGAVRGVQLFI